MSVYDFTVEAAPDMLSAMHWALAKLISPLWRRVDDDLFSSQGKQLAT